MRSNEKCGTSNVARSTAMQAWSRQSVLLRRGLLALLVTGITVTGCRGGEHATSSLTPPDESSAIDDADVPSSVIVAPALISTPTYDGSGELVHPDAVVFPSRWQGRR